MTGAAIHEARAVAALVDSGLPDWQARQALDVLGAASTYDGARYFMASDVALAARVPGLKLDGAPARARRSADSRFYFLFRADGRGGDVEYSARAFRSGLSTGGAFWS